MAHDEKEAHKLNNPNYRYRPTYRKETPTKKRRKKQNDEEDDEEEDRKCEVVARVLLEGRELNNEELQREVDEQKAKDQLEGRDRSSRSRSRSKSVASKFQEKAANNHLQGLQIPSFPTARPSSAPPTQEEQNFPTWTASGNHLFPASIANRSKRSQTVSFTSGAFELNSLYGNTYPEIPSFAGEHLRRPFESVHRPSTDLSAQFVTTSRAGLDAQLPFGEPNTSSVVDSLSLEAHQLDSNAFARNFFQNDMMGFKTQTADPSLLSPSYSRKFSLGRWEVPNRLGGQRPQMSLPLDPFYEENTAAHKLYTQNFGQGTADSITSSASSGEHQNYTADAHSNGTSFDPSMTATGSQAVPTYVYLSKEDANNPQVSVCLDFLLLF